MNLFCMEDGFAFQKDSPFFPNSLVIEFDNMAKEQDQTK